MRKYLIKHDTLYNPAIKHEQNHSTFIPLENTSIKTGTNETLTNVILLTEGSVDEKILNGIASSHKTIIGEKEFDGYNEMLNFITDFNNGVPQQITYAGSNVDISKSTIKEGEIILLVPSQTFSASGGKAEEVMSLTDGSIQMITRNNGLKVYKPYEKIFSNASYVAGQEVDAGMVLTSGDTVFVYVGGVKLIKDVDFSVILNTNNIHFLQDIDAGILVIDVFAEQQIINNSKKQDALTQPQLDNINADHSKYLTQHQDISGKADITITDGLKSEIDKEVLRINSLENTRLQKDLSNIDASLTNRNGMVYINSHGNGSTFPFLTLPVYPTANYETIQSGTIGDNVSRIVESIKLGLQPYYSTNGIDFHNIIEVNESSSIVSIIDNGAIRNIINGQASGTLHVAKRVNGIARPFSFGPIIDSLPEAQLLFKTGNDEDL